MFGIGAPELIIILFIVLIFFGANKLPGLARSLGGSVSAFKKGMRGDDDTKTIDAHAAQPAEPVPSAKSETKSS